ncbi:hypothetical protein AO366_1684 [Moraxella catarrhalis]|nr:hypothetical protein AO366_1684 [Moraxella catarrhalis]
MLITKLKSSQKTITNFGDGFNAYYIFATKDFRLGTASISSSNAR